MADIILSNSATMTGRYNNEAFSPMETFGEAVTLADVRFEKSADKSIWLDGYLIYTITIDNSDASASLTDIVIEDQIDTTKFEMDLDSVQVKIDNDVLVIETQYNLTYSAGGLLRIELVAPTEISAGSIATVSFRGTKAEETP